MPFSRTNETFGNDIKNVQLNLTQILTSGCYYTTSELINHIKHINNALDNIKLDYEFQRESKDWAKQFDAQEMKLNEANIQQLIARGHDLTEELATRLHNDTIKNKEQNQIREIHNWACDSLLEYLQALHPYASSSYARLDNMAHHLGVTDRFLGYRNNLTRSGNQPVNLHTIWADRKLPPASTPDWKDWTRAFQHNDLSATPTFQQSSNDYQTFFTSIAPTQSIDIQSSSATSKIALRSFIYPSDHKTPMSEAGMTIQYLGETETVDRYTAPKDHSYSPSLAVAQPDYTSIGRPLARLVLKSSFSEYTEKYTYPDTSKIERYPWLRDNQ